jgi:predicted nucleotide-binding protein (sugar kinase/HSP70/actin superfamily)
MRIGIPRALLYHYYYPFWYTFFESLGHEVVLSPITNPQIINAGVRISVPEICVPIKIMNGHLQYLLQIGVDYVFVPRMVSIRPGQFFCPKFMGLPDMMRFGVPGAAAKLLYPDISAPNEDISDAKHYLPLAEQLGNTTQEIRQAAKTAGETWRRFRAYCLQGIDAKTAADCAMREVPPIVPDYTGLDLHLGLLGYVYNVYDDFLSMDVLHKLRSLGVRVSTFEMLPERVITENLQHLDKTVFWTFSDKLLGAGYAFYRNPEIDGLIHLTAFGCGPDSMLGKMLDLDSNRYNKPFMTLRVDEHTGESHLQTRVEAFVDMLRLKKRQGQSFPAVDNN